MWHEILGLIVLVVGFVFSFVGGMYVNEQVHGEGSSFIGAVLILIVLIGTLTMTAKLFGIA